MLLMIADVAWVPGSAQQRFTPQRVRDTRVGRRRRTLLHHCERSEAIQNLSAVAVWIVSLRSQ
ncbi:hypothetical protein [Bradyrhizobium cosmicum]|uniref:hypothetical protein n=1 Tax=Bradyrhizobium cosmicum TaxID=1404864 RepID=UPI0028E1AD45|nr:hypothetical protein [Bradyrhizobium cosmicum]